LTKYDTSSERAQRVIFIPLIYFHNSVWNTVAPQFTTTQNPELYMKIQSIYSSHFIPSLQI